MFQHVRAAVVSLVLLTVLTGVVYPAVVTGIAQIVFPQQANGSVIVHGGKVVGSRLLGQPFDDPRYFWGRLSATAPVPYTAFNLEKSGGSSGSNLGPLNPALIDAVKARLQALKDADSQVSVTSAPAVPVDLVTASGSGLDPHISPAAASFQAPRVAKARGLPIERVQELIARRTEGRQLGVLGEPRVNVLELNLDVDAAASPTSLGPAPAEQGASSAR
jgi:K+-transporting ATPase ATPase C chain